MSGERLRHRHLYRHILARLHIMRAWNGREWIVVYRAPGAAVPHYDLADGKTVNPWASSDAKVQPKDQSDHAFRPKLESTCAST